MKKFVFILVLLCCSVFCFAQRATRKAIEVEIGAGILYSFDKIIFDYSMPGAVPYAEIRYVFKSLPLDIGLQASVQIFERRSSEDRLNFISRNFMAVADYSFYNTSRMRIYFGGCAGFGFFDHDRFLERLRPYTFSSEAVGTSPICIMPRVGIGLFRHLNFSLGYLIEDKANRNLSLRLAYVF